MYRIKLSMRRAAKEQQQKTLCTLFYPSHWWLRWFFFSWIGLLVSMCGCDSSVSALVLHSLLGDRNSVLSLDPPFFQFLPFSFPESPQWTAFFFFSWSSLRVTVSIEFRAELAVVVVDSLPFCLLNESSSLWVIPYLSYTHSLEFLNDRSIRAVLLFFFFAVPRNAARLCETPVVTVTSH